MKKLKIIIPLIIGFFLIWYTYSKFTPTQFAELKQQFTKANYFYVVLSMIFGFASHLSRAYRWRYTLEPMGYKTSYANSLMAVGIAYLMNLAIPRSGEVSRALVLSRYEKIPFEKGFGTIVAERIADLIILLSLILTAFILKFDVLVSFLEDKNINTSKFIILIIAGGLLFLIFLYLLKRTKSKTGQKIKGFILGLKEGIMTIITMKKKWQFIAHTIFIWCMYLIMFYVCFFAIKETSNVSVGTSIIAFVMGSLSVSFTNGGIGSYPFLVAETLLLFGIDYASGTALGWIIWSCQTLLVIVYGALSFLFLPVYNRKK
ncbi:lysylphosphatidylglycerol synthase transmembrane domain-containing protein [Abyssalbus ytuae]|uniref:Flippase-like domain-containing protein n=1 Tax=Abyssalbus ytuae TaxID=2926907 RepID=A0A9E6ZP80_9FLAO|nr:lysylphosphatidylglycerol synthase transmembrane domain-containing protein [Abyssalbus ytuae]UOB16203.1 flippase-like domain-containing protein [Abyssalbus ytuae]